MASTHFDSAPRSNASLSCDIVATGCTICGWCAYDAVSLWQAILQAETSGGSGVVFETDDSNTELGVYVENDSWGFTGSGFVPSDGVWFFWALIFEAGTVKIRISSDYSTITHSVTASNYDATGTISAVTMASDEFAEHMVGQLHHVRVFAGALSDAQLLAEMASNSAVLPAHAAWELNDASLADSSGNGRNLSGTGGTVSVGSSSAPVPAGSGVTLSVLGEVEGPGFAAELQETNELSIGAEVEGPGFAAQLQQTVAASVVAQVEGPGLSAALATVNQLSVAGQVEGPGLSASLRQTVEVAVAAVVEGPGFAAELKETNQLAVLADVQGPGLGAEFVTTNELSALAEVEGPGLSAELVLSENVTLSVLAEVEGPGLSATLQVGDDVSLSMVGEVEGPGFAAQLQQTTQFSALAEVEGPGLSAQLQQTIGAAVSAEVEGPGFAAQLQQTILASVAAEVEGPGLSASLVLAADVELSVAAEVEGPGFSADLEVGSAPTTDPPTVTGWSAPAGPTVAGWSAPAGPAVAGWTPVNHEAQAA